MKQYSKIHIPVLSFCSKSLYRDVCVNWTGTGFAYLGLLLAVCWIPTIASMHQALSRFIEDDASRIVSQIPTISIVDGEASIAEAQPYYIRDSWTGKALAVIDTTDNPDSLADPDASVMITRTAAIVKKNTVETQTFAFKEVKELTIDRDTVSHWLGVAKAYAALVLYPLALLGSFVFRIVQALLYAAIGMLFASWCNSKRTYAELLRLSVVAVTPCIITTTLLGIVPLNVPALGLWCFLATMGYLWFGIKAASAEASPVS